MKSIRNLVFFAILAVLFGGAVDAQATCSECDPGCNSAPYCQQCQDPNLASSTCQGYCSYLSGNSDYWLEWAPDACDPTQPIYGYRMHCYCI